MTGGRVLSGFLRSDSKPGLARVVILDWTYDPGTDWLGLLIVPILGGRPSLVPASMVTIDPSLDWPLVPPTPQERT